MNYSAYLKMNSQEIETEINKQRQKIKNINEQITLLKKLKIAAEVTEKSTESKNIKPENPNIQNSQTAQPKPTTNPTAGGLPNGAFRKVHG